MKYYAPLMLRSAAAAVLFAGSIGVACAHPPVGVPGGRPLLPPMPAVPVNPGPQRPVHNPNGPSPVGRATSAPDTDRGNSEGRGRTDTAGGAHAVVGTVASFSGDTLTLTLRTGVSKTFTVDAHAFGALRPQKGQQLAVKTDAQGHAARVVPANQRITGTVTNVTKDTVTLKLPNGRSQTVSIASQAAAHISLSPGMHTTIVSHDGGQTASSIVPNRKH